MPFRDDDEFWFPDKRDASEKANEISLGDNLGAVTVKVNGVTIDVGSDGTVKVRSANDDAKPKVGAEIGEEMADGTIYAGISPDTLKPMYARPKDESGTYSFNEAAKHAKDVGGGFHVPSKGELNVLYENRNKGKLKGTFNETGSDPAGWYLSSTPYDYHVYCYVAWAQRFSDGNQDYYGFNSFNGSSLRLIR